jgi:hypothetical protein
MFHVEHWPRHACGQRRQAQAKIWVRAELGFLSTGLFFGESSTLRDSLGRGLATGLPLGSWSGMLTVEFCAVGLSTADPVVVARGFTRE